MDLAIKLMPDTNEFDLDLRRWELEFDDGLETAILRSLFENGRVTVDELNEGETDRFGWWGDAASNPDNVKSGSKLWLLERGKTTDETLEAAREYCEEALQWLIDDGVAESVTVTTEYLDKFTLAIGIEIQRPGVDRKSSKYDFVWEVRQSGV